MQVLRGKAAADYREMVRNRINVSATSDDGHYFDITLSHPDGREEPYGRMTLSRRQMFDLFANPENYAAILESSERAS